MLIALSLYPGDQAQGLAVLEWIAELGGVRGHQLLLAHSPATDIARHRVVAERAFGSVEIAQHPTEAPTVWPQGTNWSFIHTLDVIGSRGPFFWLEADMLPLRASWVDDLEEEYRARNAAFLGRENPTLYARNGAILQEGTHLNGACIYPPNVHAYLPNLKFAVNRKNGEINPVPWDVLCAYQMWHRVHPQGDFQSRNGGQTSAMEDRIQHGFATDKIGMIFKSRNFREEADGRIVCDKEFPRTPDCPVDFERQVIFHGCKDDSLLRLVRQRLGFTKTNHVNGSNGSHLPQPKAENSSNGNGTHPAGTADAAEDAGAGQPAGQEGLSATRGGDGGETATDDLSTSERCLVAEKQAPHRRQSRHKKARKKPLGSLIPSLTDAERFDLGRQLHTGKVRWRDALVKNRSSAREMKVIKDGYYKWLYAQPEELKNAELALVDSERTP